MTRLFRRACLWLVFRGPRLPGNLAPLLFGWGIGARGQKVSDEP